MVRTATKRTCWDSAPTMKVITGAEAGRRRGARRRNQTPGDRSSTFHLYRRMTAYLGVGWRDFRNNKGGDVSDVISRHSSTMPRLVKARKSFAQERLLRSSHAKRRKMSKMMRSRGYCCVNAGHPSLRTMAAGAGIVDPFDVVGMLGN